MPFSKILKRNSFLSFAVCIVAAGTAWAEPDPAGAIAAMKAMPFKFDNGILKISGISGAPQPAEWIVIARDADSMGTITQLTVAGGQVISQRPSGNLGQMFREDGFLSAQSIEVDSAEVFRTAVNFAKERHGVEVASVNYELSKPASDLGAVWNVVCRDAAGNSVGRLEISAANGSVMTESEFKPKR